jgi:hypothetical protein
MARCYLGDKKLRRIASIVGPRFTVHGATVRGGETHYYAKAFLIERETDKHIIAWVNYKTGVVEWPEEGEPGTTWRLPPPSL